MNDDQSMNQGEGTEKPKTLSRRDVLKVIGSGLATGALLMTGVGSVKAFAKLGQASSNDVQGEPILIKVNSSSPGYRIPNDFAGIGFERGPLNPGNAGVNGYIFSGTNQQLITLFRNVGIKDLRIGGGSMDNMALIGSLKDGWTGVDNLFAFAAAADIKVLFTQRLLNPANKPIPDLMAKNVEIAKYVWQNYSSYVSSFAIGNEPDWHSFHTSKDRPSNDPLIYETVSGVPGSAFPSYLEDWRAFANAVREAIPEAKFTGPDTGSYLGAKTYSPDPGTGVSWTQLFAENEKDSHLIKDISQHLYVGDSPRSTTPEQAIRNMLSPEWVNDTELGAQPAGSGTDVTHYTPYPWMYKQNIEPVLNTGLTYRLTESNDYLTGVDGASNAFSVALWALDYMHWWAAHQAAGVNFHNKQWINSDTFIRDADKNYQITPKGYGIRAFNLGAKGQVMPVDISNPNSVNLTAYAVGEGHNLYVTIINKTYGSGAEAATVTIVPDNFTAKNASMMVLESGKPGDPSARTATLGGSAMTNSELWDGKWSHLDVHDSGKVVVTVQPASAAIVRING